jgi:hypothetical protein
VSTAYAGPSVADDHISLAADEGGRVFAAVKTALDEAGDPDAPLVALLVRDPTTGAWSQHTVGRVRDSHTRPIVVLDEEEQVHVLATARCCSGTIYEKTSPADAIAFPAGAGTPFVHDAAAPTVNNVTSTKQTVGAASGLLVLASNDATTRYWHNHRAIGPPAPPPPPTPGPEPVVFAAAADAYVKSSAPAKNTGSETTLRLKAPTSTYPTEYRAYLAFDVSGLTGTVASAKLRLHVADAAPDGGSGYGVDNGWTELGLTWSNAPAVSGTPLGHAGPAVLGTWVEIDVTPAITGDGTYSFALTTTSSNFVYYSSRETANPPRLVVTQQ